MLKMSSQKFYRLSAIIFLSIPALILLIISSQVWIFDYETWVSYLLKLADKEDWGNYFRERILSPNRFLYLRYILLIFNILSLVLTFVLVKKRHRIFNTLTSDNFLAYNAFKSSFASLGKAEFFLIFGSFVFFLARALYTIFNTELQYDEAWTFVHFSSRGLIVSALSPNNNHFLYSIFSALCWKLNIDAKIAVRLPALLFTSISLLVLFIALSKTFGKKISISILIIISISIPFYFFSVLGRAYSSMLLFTILSIFSVLNFEENSSKKGFLLRLYLLSSVLGCYSNPAYVYVWFANLLVFSALNFKEKKTMLDFLKTNLFAFILVVLLFSPMIIAGGFGILGSAATKNIETGDFLLYLNRLADWLIIGKKFNFFIALSVLAVLFFVTNKLLFKYQGREKYYWIQFYWLLPFLIFIITGIESPYRIWFWAPVFFWIQFFIILNQIRLASWIKNFVITAIFAFNFMASQQHYFMNWSVELDKESKKIADIIIKNTKGAISCYTFSRYDKPLLEYYFLINKRQYKTYMPFVESKNYKSFENGEYDAVLLDTDEYSASKSELTKIENGYKLLYQNKRIKLFISSKI